MSVSLIVILVVAVIGFFYVTKTYNNFVVLKNRVKEAWSDIQVQLKRRYDLIPNLVEVVKGYAKHESETLEKVIKARNMAMASAGGGVEAQAKAENALSSTLKSLFALSESYPDLKANQNFLELQKELTDTENKLGAARKFYNTNANEMNIAVESFPSNIIASLFKFKRADLFELDADEAAAAKKAPKIQF